MTAYNVFKVFILAGLVAVVRSGQSERTNSRSIRSLESMSSWQKWMQPLAINKNAVVFEAYAGSVHYGTFSAHVLDLWKFKQQENKESASQGQTTR